MIPRVRASHSPLDTRLPAEQVRGAREREMVRECVWERERGSERECVAERERGGDRASK